MNQDMPQGHCKLRIDGLNEHADSMSVFVLERAATRSAIVPWCQIQKKSLAIFFCIFGDFRQNRLNLYFIIDF